MKATAAIIIVSSCGFHVATTNNEDIILIEQDHQQGILSEPLLIEAISLVEIPHEIFIEKEKLQNSPTDMYPGTSVSSLHTPRLITNPVFE